MISRDDRAVHVSHDSLRLLIGYLGVTLPFLLVLGAWTRQTSISDYYYTNMRDYFEGVLFFLAMFLFAYRPYGQDGWQDRILTDISGASALLLALFPTNNPTLQHIAQPVVLQFFPAAWSGVLHDLASALLFLSFAVLSLFYFTRSKPGRRATKKLWRNAIYILCGLGITVCIGLIGWGNLTAPTSQAKDLRNILVPESIALVLFGFSWLIKGGLFLRDPL